jgi:serine/threonine protein kinase
VQARQGFSGTLLAMNGSQMTGQTNLETILRPGQLVGAQYRVEKFIAKGGMAAVWAGVNEHTGKRVALKVILQSFASNGEAVELFRREALAASKVNHPNVVNIFDVIDHGGMTCIVMELFDGENLGSYLTRNGPLSLDTTLSLLLPAMRGVAAANAQGVVHRDLKPANIFLCSSSEGRLITTKVLDFGISVMMKRAGETAAATEQLSMFGTPAYMAPEAIENSPNIDGRADVYGFGVLFFEALTGKLPFPGPPGLELLKRILTDPAPKVTLYRPDLPSDVVNLIACALAKDPNDRFSDMEHLIRATEDRPLPLLAAARSSTPISGISLLPSDKPNIGVPVPVVQAVFEEEPSDLVHLNQTRVLYSMPSQPASGMRRLGLGGTAQSQRKTRTPAHRKLVSISNPWRTLNRRVAVGAAIVVFLIVTAWVTVPASSRDRGVGKGQSSAALVPAAPAPVPLPTPPPISPSPDPEPAVAVDEPSDSGPDGGSERVIVQRAPTVRSFRTAGSHFAGHATHARLISLQPSPAELPVQLAIPRAGTLSESDF